ncbi:MAG: acetyl-CoA carboxylase biotin carboxylase subunit [Cyclobacteriaceae bacterium]|nr:acetyl-CoA carboxylase biotin carboxylase subunit [Cyclobacteriaceae bacterium]
MKIKKILIANRGEIAVRIIRAAKEMNIGTVAIYSDADRQMPHSRMADESYPLGSPDPADSYLHQEKIIAIAEKSQADAIHPGYGFLSENFEFAEKVQEAGLIFIGPQPESIRMMGDKLISKTMAQHAGVPVIPGYDRPILNLEEIFPVAKKIGYPILIKATAGGGGKGMRIVRNENELSENVERARSEAKNAFDSDIVFLEKYIQQPRHIEIQVLGDTLGNYVHLFERDCSIQRRHQKLVEESPSPAVDEELRKKLTVSAIAIAKSCGYQGAGTVEFVVDRQRNFYFLEMNTRLQVEHPVTELITGIDLVKEQILIAQGEKLSVTQENIRQKGHAIEFRVYAEDPFQDFLPSSGYLSIYKTPKGPGIRVDDGYEEHLSVPIHYDPLIGKLLVHSHSRENAIRRLKNAIEEYHISPLRTTLDFGKILCSHKSFILGDYDTSFIEREFKPENHNPNHADESLIAAALAGFVFAQKHSRHEPAKQKSKNSNGWQRNRR